MAGLLEYYYAQCQLYIDDEVNDTKKRICRTITIQEEKLQGQGKLPHIEDYNIYAEIVYARVKCIGNIEKSAGPKVLYRIG